MDVLRLQPGTLLFPATHKDLIVDPCPKQADMPVWVFLGAKSCDTKVLTVLFDRNRHLTSSTDCHHCCFDHCFQKRAIKRWEALIGLQLLRKVFRLTLSVSNTKAFFWWRYLAPQGCSKQKWLASEEPIRPLSTWKRRPLAISSTYHHKRLKAPRVVIPPFLWTKTPGWKS